MLPSALGRNATSALVSHSSAICGKAAIESSGTLYHSISRSKRKQLAALTQRGRLVLQSDSSASSLVLSLLKLQYRRHLLHVNTLPYFLGPKGETLFGGPLLCRLTRCLYPCLWVGRTFRFSLWLLPTNLALVISGGQLTRPSVLKSHSSIVREV